MSPVSVGVPARRPRSVARDAVLGGLFIALALVLPMAFHLIGVGSVFLPMHIPIFLAGFMVSPWVAGVVGLASPLLSAVLTGMPPFSPPIAQAMVFELATYGLVTALLYRATRRIYLSWMVAAVSGRVVSGLVGVMLLPLFGFTAVPILYPITTALVAGLPGIALQAAFVPGIVYLVERASGGGVAPPAKANGGTAKGGGSA